MIVDFMRLIMSLDPYIIHIPGASPQELNEINAILKRAAQSNGKVFLVLDPKSQMIGTTRDKDKASSMKEVASWLHSVAQSVGKERRGERKDLNLLRANVMVIENGYRYKRNFIQRIFDRVMGTDQAIKNLNEHLDNRLSDYGTYKKQEKIKSSTYQKAGGLRKGEKELEAMNQFAKLRDLSRVSMTRLEKAFESELAKVYPYRMGATKDAYNTVNAFVDQGFRLIAQQPGLHPKEAFNKFKWRLLQEMTANNRVVLNMDRAIFADIMGDRVKNLTVEQLADADFRLPEGIDVSSPEVKKMLQEYRDGTWKDDEERILTYDVMNPKEFGRMEQALNKIFNDENFQEAFSHWYNGLSEPHQS